jgi:iron complex transport system substrate-binding protein
MTGQVFKSCLFTTIVGLVLAVGEVSAAALAGWSAVDDTGAILSLSAPAQRVVSLSPGATAMLFAAGADRQIVGTADFSDEPEAARLIPRIGDSQGYDLERILALRPDVIITWGGGTNAAVLERLRRTGIPIYQHRVSTLAGIPSAIARLGDLIGTSAAAARTVTDLTTRIDALKRRADTGTTTPSSVLLQVWDRPVYTVGGTQLMSDAIATCGYQNAFGELRDAGPAIALESVLRRNPAVIIAIAPDQNQAAEWLDHWRVFGALAAVRNHRLLALTDQRFSRLGPAVIDATEALCQRLRSLDPA